MTLKPKAPRSRLAIAVGIVEGNQLRPGMILHRESNATNGFDVVGPITGQCEHGRHFGSGCYDRIAKWWLYEEVGK